MSSDLPGVMSSDDTQLPLLFIDTAGAGLRELDAGVEDSKGNEGEKGGEGRGGRARCEGSRVSFNEGKGLEDCEREE